MLDITTTLPLNNGLAMPALGFGVFQTPPEDTISSAKAALNVGYRLIDTERIAENAALFDFELSAEEMQSIDGLESGIRGGYAPEEGNRNQFPAIITD